MSTARIVLIFIGVILTIMILGIDVNEMFNALLTFLQEVRQK